MCTGLTRDGDAENKLSITLPGSDSFLKWIFDHKSTSILKTVFLNLVIFFKSMGFFFYSCFGNMDMIHSEKKELRNKSAEDRTCSQNLPEPGALLGEAKGCSHIQEPRRASWA